MPTGLSDQDVHKSHRKAVWNKSERSDHSQMFHDMACPF